MGRKPLLPLRILLSSGTDLELTFTIIVCLYELSGFEVDLLLNSNGDWFVYQVMQKFWPPTQQYLVIACLPTSSHTGILSFYTGVVPAEIMYYNSCL